LLRKNYELFAQLKCENRIFPLHFDCTEGHSSRFRSSYPTHGVAFAGCHRAPPDRPPAGGGPLGRPQPPAGIVPSPSSSRRPLFAAAASGVCETGGARFRAAAAAAAAAAENPNRHEEYSPSARSGWLTADFCKHILTGQKNIKYSKRYLMNIFQSPLY